MKNGHFPKILLVSAAILTFPVDTRAQTPAAPPGDALFFVGAGIGAEADNTWGDEAPPPGIVTVTGGVNVSKHLGIRLSLDVPQMFSTTDPPITTGSIRTLVSREHRTVGWSVLADFHTQQSAGRAQIGVLGGVTFARHQSKVTVSTDQLGTGGTVVGQASQTIDNVFNWFGLTGGAEVPVRLMSRLQIVPMATFTLFVPSDAQGNTIVRGGVEARWQF